MVGVSDREQTTVRWRRWVRPEDVVDVFVYVTVINLAVQFVPDVISESFTLSLLTAVVLKIVLEAVIAVKNRLKGRFESARTLWRKAAAVFVLWLVLVGSKFLVLEIIALVFRDQVSLGGFWAVTGLIVVLMLARSGVRLLLKSNG